MSGDQGPLRSDSFGKCCFDVHSDVFVKLIGDVLAHMLHLGSVSPHDVSSFVAGFFRRPVFERLMQVLVRHEDNDRTERMIVHFHFVAPGDAAADYPDELVLKFQMVMSGSATVHSCNISTPDSRGTALEF